MMAKQTLIITEAKRAVRVTLIVTARDPNKEIKLDWMDSKIMEGGGSKYHRKFKAWKRTSHKMNRLTITIMEWVLGMLGSL